jgi:hypothetical protein
VDAIRYFYHLSQDPPAEPFCTEEELGTDPTCALFDSGKDPLRDSWASFYRDGLAAILAAGVDPDPADDIGLNELLAFARNGEGGNVAVADRSLALSLAFEPARIPLSAEDAANPSLVSFANREAEIVLRRTLLDPATARGAIVDDISDPDVLALLSAKAGSLVRNEDGARPYALRRTAIDVLRAEQSISGLGELKRSRQALQDALTQHPPTDEDEGLAVEDLIARIDAALSPYFE